MHPDFPNYWIYRRWRPYVQAFMAVRGEYGDFEGRFPDGRCFYKQDWKELEVYLIIQQVVKQHIKKEITPKTPWQT